MILAQLLQNMEAKRIPSFSLIVIILLIWCFCGQECSGFTSITHKNSLGKALSWKRHPYHLEASNDGIDNLMENVLFIEVGFGNDQHGQNPTKACVRACRNAIEFNSIPSIQKIVPGGYENMKLRIQLAVPVEPEEIDEDQIKAVFPYGNILPIEYQKGGMMASSGIALEAMGDKNDQMIIAIACVSVGY
mmetsp:Transcript_26241/g.32754  ORF Transcript_26241/g.32754 Transcript_26241/m.32754 type:complete len:190 (-) Transcript_26241:326-895(-)